MNNKYTGYTNKKRVMLTGNRGYIGTVMTRFLRENSCSVVGLDVNWYRNNDFSPVPEESRPDRQILKDIRDITEDDLKGIDAVIHLAGLSNDPLGELNPDLTEDINFRATIKTAELCKKIGIERFIFASSCSIYGVSAAESPINEDGKINPITAYAKAKIKSEVYLSKLADKDFHPVFMRNATVYGSSAILRLGLVVNNLAAWAWLTGKITIMSDGVPWRPIIHIEDLCRAFIAALKSPLDRIHCQYFNVGINEENYQVRDIAREIQNILPESEITILNETGKDERTYKVDFTKIRKYLPAFKPEWNLRKGIIELLETYKKYNLTMDDFKSDRYFRVRTIRRLTDSKMLDDRLCWKDSITDNKISGIQL